MHYLHDGAFVHHDGAKSVFFYICYFCLAWFVLTALFLNVFPLLSIPFCLDLLLGVYVLW